MMRVWYFPKKRKSADVIMLSQQRNTGSFPQNCRHIILLPAMSKIAKKIIVVGVKRYTKEFKNHQRSNLDLNIDILPNVKYNVR